MAKKPTVVKGGDPAKRAEAYATINGLIQAIDVLWQLAAKTADRAGVKFYYTAPNSDHGGGVYYPKRPKDWHNYEDEPDHEEDVNKDHPEYEDYHPWNECNSMGTEYDWSTGNWISSSERC